MIEATISNNNCRKYCRRHCNSVNMMTMTTVIFGLVNLTIQFPNAHGHSVYNDHSFHRYSNGNENDSQVLTLHSVTSAALTDSNDYAMQFLMEYNNKQRHLHSIDLEQTKIHNTQSNLIHHTKLLETEIFAPTTPQRFVELCTGFLLSDQIISDSEISNDEAALFFEYLCNELPRPQCQNKKIPFYSLDVEIQMSFVNAICPRDAETNATLDKQCIEKLRKVVDSKNQFAYEITPDRDVQADVERYCSSIYSLSTAFHNGTYQPSPTPSVAPSSSPTYQPSMAPTNTPSLVVSSPPSLTPSPTISTSPSISPSPTTTQTFPTPSTQPPTGVIQYQTSFTYMMGFDNELVHNNVLNDQRPDIMEATSQAIVTTLNSTFRLVQKTRVLLRGSGEEAKEPIRRKWQNYIRYLQSLGFRDDENNGVTFPVKIDESCTDAFTESTNCIIVVSEVTLESATKITKEDVNQAVYKSMRDSMIDDSFRNEINFIEVKEVKYLYDGPYVPINPREPLGTIGVGGGSIAGITIGSVLFLLLLAFFVGRARARSEDESVNSGSLDSDSDLYQDDEEGQQQQRSLGFDDLDAEIVNPANADMNKEDMVTPISRNLPVIDEVEGGNEETLKETGLQFDTTSGQVLGSVSASAAMSYVSSGCNSASSGYSADNPESPTRIIRKGDALVDQLDAAVQAGDWAAVAAIAGDLSQADDISTMSSFHSRAGDISYDPSERDNLSEKDTKRAKEIDRLIAEGDWNAVGATAADFEADASSTGSKEENGQQKSKTPPQEGTKRRSILDFITGPWNSTAAEKAIAGK